MRVAKYKNKDGEEVFLGITGVLNLNYYTQDENLHTFVSKILESYKETKGIKIKPLDFYKTTKLIFENIIYSNYAGVALSLGNSFYSNIPKRYNPAKISGRKIRTVLYFLESVQLLDIYKGFNGKKSYFTRIVPSKGLTKELKATGLKKLQITFDRKMERIVMKSSKDKGKKLIDYKETNRIYSERKFIWEYEDFLSNFDFKCDGDKLGRIYLKRVFNNDSWKNGGRFYSNYQNIKSHIRSSKLTCSGAPMKEYDYSGMHINMLYAMENLGLYEGDVYTVKGHEELRNIFKIALQIAINAKDRRSAYSGMNEHLRKHGIDTKEISGKKILNAFAEKHKPIEKYFFSGIGVYLQYKDSLIAKFVLEKGLKHNIPVLPVHDSYLVPEDQSETLIRWMNEASEKILGVKLTIDEK